MHELAANRADLARVVCSVERRGRARSGAGRTPAALRRLFLNRVCGPLPLKLEPAMKMLERGAALIDLTAHSADSLDALYRRYSAWLGGALRRRFGASVAPFAEDMVQETYARVAPYHAAGVIRHPKAFLLRVASNITRDHLRREKLNIVVSSAAEFRADDQQYPEQVAALQLKEVILALPVQYRDMFVMSRFGGLTYEEIAHHCGLSVKTVEWRMKKALAFCANRLLD
jgi:RNA polymerase sigma-70 factor (ECF subfamily)